MRRPAALFAGAIAAVAVAAFAAGIAVMGSPAAIRDRLLDDRRIEDLRRIARALDTQMARTHALPASLEALNTATQPASFRLTDPATAEPYDYATTGPRSYRLCATFGRPGGAKFWLHGAGRHCFAVDMPDPAPTPDATPDAK